MVALSEKFRIFDDLAASMPAALIKLELWQF